jgi:hypothetical protein
MARSQACMGGTRFLNPFESGTLPGVGEQVSTFGKFGTVAFSGILLGEFWQL